VNNFYEKALSKTENICASPLALWQGPRCAQQVNLRGLITLDGKSARGLAQSKTLREEQGLQAMV